MQSKQKAGQKGKKTADKPKVAKQAAEEVPKDFFMATLGPAKRNKIKKMKIIVEMEAKSEELNWDQLEKISKKNELKEEIDKLDYYIDLYEKTHPDWNKPAEETKVEEPEPVAPSEDVINQHVVNAFTKFAQMLTLRQIVDHTEISENEKSHLTDTMAPYHTLVQVNETLEGGDKQAAFAQAMVAAVNDQVLQELCGKCFSEEQLSKTRLRIASAKEVVPAQVEVVAEPVAEPVQEVVVEAAAHADVPATEEPAAENVEANKDAVDAPAEAQGEAGTKNATEHPVSAENVQEEAKQSGEQPVAEESKEKRTRHEGDGRGNNRGRHNNDRRGRGGDNRPHRGGRGGKSFGDQVDEDGFQTQADRQQRSRGGQRGGRGGRGGERGGNYRGNYNGDRDQNNEFRKGGGRGGRGGKPSDRPETATATAAPVTGEGNNKGTMEGKQE